MWTTKRLCICLLACSLWLAAGSTSQAEEMYQISESELTELETNLETLKAHNQERQKVLTEQATLLNQQKETIKKQAGELRRLKKDSERGDAEIITESQSIIAAVRGRGKKEN